MEQRRADFSTDNRSFPSLYLKSHRPSKILPLQKWDIVLSSHGPLYILAHSYNFKNFYIFIKTAPEVAEKLLTCTLLSVTLYCPGIRIKILYINIFPCADVYREPLLLGAGFLLAGRVLVDFSQGLRSCMTLNSRPHVDLGLWDDVHEQFCGRHAGLKVLFCHNVQEETIIAELKGRHTL
jgi:hypothetical protein